jgi:curli production assembly/transport component CsgG
LIKNIVAATSLLLILTACQSITVEPPAIVEIEHKIVAPPKDGPIVVAVYSFQDKTGQRKDGGNVAKLSSAVTQGGETILIEALQDVGDRKWFRVVERIGLDNLIKERQLIRSAREDAKDDTTLRPLLYAGVIVEGAIVAYDSSIQSGGLGARLMGIGAQTQYSQDMVTVSIRCVSVQTGEILLTVTTQKTILGFSAGQDIFRFYDLNQKAFEQEFGKAENEAVSIAVRKAINSAVEEMVFKGERLNYWRFKEQE